MTLWLGLGESSPTTTYELTNTHIIDISYNMGSIKFDSDINIYGKPIVRPIGQGSPSIDLTVIIAEAENYSGDETFGLTDLDDLRKVHVGTTGTGVFGTKCWLRDDTGDYFSKDWKAGYISGSLNPKPVKGHQNFAATDYTGGALYEVSFTFTVIDETGYTFMRW